MLRRRASCLFRTSKRLTVQPQQLLALSILLMVMCLGSSSCKRKHWCRAVTLSLSHKWVSFLLASMCLALAFRPIISNKMLLILIHHLRTSHSGQHPVPCPSPLLLHPRLLRQVSDSILFSSRCPLIFGSEKTQKRKEASNTASGKLGYWSSVSTCSDLCL
jgi:hypothetical protein